MELLLRQGTTGTQGDEGVTLESLCHHRDTEEPDYQLKEA